MRWGAPFPTTPIQCRRSTLWIIWDGALSRNSKIFRFSTFSLRSKVVRTWILISVVIHAFLLWKYCIAYGLEKLGNFRKHRGFLLFPKATGLHTLNPLEDTKNVTVSHSFDFLPPLRILDFLANPVSRRALKRSPDSPMFQMSSAE